MMSLMHADGTPLGWSLPQHARACMAVDPPQLRTTAAGTPLASPAGQHSPACAACAGAAAPHTSCNGRFGGTSMCSWPGTHPASVGSAAGSAGAAPSSLPISQRLGQRWQVPAASASRAAQQAAVQTSQPLSLLQMALLVETQPQPTPWQRHLDAATSQQQQQRPPLPQPQQQQQHSSLRTATGGWWYSEQLRGAGSQQHMQPGRAQVASVLRQPLQRPQDYRLAHRQAQLQAEQQQSFAAFARTGLPQTLAAAATVLFGRPVSMHDRRRAADDAAAHGANDSAAAAALMAGSGRCSLSASTNSAHRQHGMALVTASAAPNTPAGTTAGIGGSFGRSTRYSGEQLPSAAAPAGSRFAVNAKPSTFLLPPAHRYGM